MGKPFRHYWIVGIGLIASVTASGKAGQAEAPLTITLQVYNRAKVPHKTLIQSGKEVREIFSKVGVYAVWRVMPLPLEQNQSLDHKQSFSSHPQLSILITPDSAARGMEERLGLKKQSVFGLSPRPSDGRGGRLAYVFYHRVREFILKRTLFEQEALVLGLAIAHEVGHLLLPHNSHSRTGVMRARFDRQDLRLAAFGDLIFTAQQAESIRAEVARRLKEQEESRQGK